jgi:acetolactate synthase-1/2/3 large subunit
VIHVDIDPEVFHRNVRTAVAIASDAAEFANSVAARLVRRRSSSQLAADIARGHGEVLAGWTRKLSRDRVSPWRLFASLQRIARPDAVYTTDSGNGTFLAMEHLRLAAPGRFLGPMDFSCMGYAVPAAIGAALAFPGRDVVALAGDGALLMTGLELVTASARGAAPVVIVLRDGKHGLIAQFQKIPLNRETSSVLQAFDVEGLAAATKCRYFRIVSDTELDGVLPAAFAAARDGVPAVVEVAIDYSQKTYFARGVVTTNFWRLPAGDRLRTLGRALGRRVVG